MHFRHFFYLIATSYLFRNAPVFWAEIGPEFQFGLEKNASDLKRQYIGS